MSTSRRREGKSKLEFEFIITFSHGIILTLTAWMTNHSVEEKQKLVVLTVTVASASFWVNAWLVAILKRSVLYYCFKDWSYRWLWLICSEVTSILITQDWSDLPIDRLVDQACSSLTYFYIRKHVMSRFQYWSLAKVIRYSRVTFLHSCCNRNKYGYIRKW